MITRTIPMQRAPEELFDKLIVLEAIPTALDGQWKRYEAELKAIFSFEPGSDPLPSEWFSAEEFDMFRPYLEAVGRARRAGMLAEEALGRRVTAQDIIGQDRATKDHDEAILDREAASAQQRRLDRTGLGEMRLRVADRLELRRQGLELPSDLIF